MLKAWKISKEVKFLLFKSFYLVKQKFFECGVVKNCKRAREEALDGLVSEFLCDECVFAEGLAFFELGDLIFEVFKK